MSTWRAEQLVQSATAVLEQVKELHDKIDALKQPFGIFKGYEPLKYIRCRLDPAKYWDKLCEILEEDRKINERNLETHRFNQSLIQRVIELIEATGIKSKTKVFKRNKPVEEHAAWALQLRVAMPDGYEPFAKSEDAHRRHVDARAKAERDRQIAEQAKVKELAAKELAAKVAVAAARLGLPITSDIEEVREHLLGNKYLDLAVAGERTRNDWNDGCWQVEAALSRFTVETEIDRLVFDEWQGICCQFEDGRSFRDCIWNYNRIKGLVDPKTLEIWSSLET